MKFKKKFNLRFSPSFESSKNRGVAKLDEKYLEANKKKLYRSSSALDDRSETKLVDGCNIAGSWLIVGRLFNFR